MTQAQTKYLLQQLDDVKRSKPQEYQDSGLPKPAKVKAAEKQAASAQEVIDEHKKADREYRRKRTLAISDSYHAAKRQILFGDPEAAIKAIDKFRDANF